MVCCWPMSSSLITTSPPRWIMPKMGGFSFWSVPRPGAPLSTASGCPLCPATPYTSSHSTSPLNCTGFFHHHTLPQLRGHVLHDIFIQVQFGGDLLVG